MKHFGKILNKNKKGCVIFAYASKNKLNLTWEDFNEKFQITDKYYVDLNDHMQQVFKETNDLLDKAVVYQLRIMTPGITNMDKMALASILLTICHKISELNDIPMNEVILLLKDRLNQVQNLGFMPRDGMKNLHRINEDNESLLSESEDAMGRSQDSNSPTLGDLPGMDKLRAKFNQ